MASSLGAFESWLKYHFLARPGWGPPASPPDPLFSLRVGPLYLAGCPMASCAATSLIVSGAPCGPGPSFPSLGYPGLLVLYPAHSRHATNTCHVSPCPLRPPLGPSAVCTRRGKAQGKGPVEALSSRQILPVLGRFSPQQLAEAFRVEPETFWGPWETAEDQSSPDISAPVLTAPRPAGNVNPSLFLSGCRDTLPHAGCLKAGTLRLPVLEAVRAKLLQAALSATGDFQCSLAFLRSWGRHPNPSLPGPSPHLYVNLLEVPSPWD